MGVGAIGLVLAGVLALVGLSYVVEAARRRPRAPQTLSWAPDIAIRYINIGDSRVRYIKVGSGPNLVLLHTLRTQLDIFQKTIPLLAERFTVYAWDFPGHGWSDIPHSDFAPEDFYRWTADILDALEIEQACLAGVSIGGTSSLVLAARGNPRITRVVAINPYDYWPAGGIRKSSLMARLILGPAGVPILGATLMRLRNVFVSDLIMEGGVATPESLPVNLRRELYVVGNRPGQYQGFLSLLAHEREWPRARSEYSGIAVPTLLIYGEQDWAPHSAREIERTLLPNAVKVMVSGGGHFLPLDRPADLTHLISDFLNDPAARRARDSGATP
jgi:pimeloyl-ACP methyl ester carboxylesterase